MTSQAETRSLRFVSWNTDGMKNTSKSPQKISEFLNNLVELHADVVFMQETHTGPQGYQNFENSVQKYWNVFFTVYDPKSKGVAILIKKDIQFEYICHDEDYSGGYIVLFCYLYGELFTLVNVYKHKHDTIVLGRLKEYLMETAEGVLVVGGGFNILLYPSFDWKPSTSRHSSQRELLKDFTASLNLRDTWSYKYPSDMVYTRHQNDSYSRLDMFFMQNDTMERVCDISIITSEIFDHYPVVLELRVQQKTRSKIPKVALFLDEFGYQGEADRSLGKISGAEILTAIKSLADSEEQRPDGLPVDYYKRFQHPMSEILKIHYNLMFKNKYVPEVFKNWLNPSGRHIFNVDYLIFSDILARRLNALISNSLKGNMEKDTLLIVTFKDQH